MTSRYLSGMGFARVRGLFACYLLCYAVSTWRAEEGDPAVSPLSRPWQDSTHTVYYPHRGKERGDNTGLISALT